MGSESAQGSCPIELTFRQLIHVSLPPLPPRRGEIGSLVGVVGVAPRGKVSGTVRPRLRSSACCAKRRSISWVRSSRLLAASTVEAPRDTSLGRAAQTTESRCWGIHDRVAEVSQQRVLDWGSIEIDMIPRCQGTQTHSVRSLGNIRHKDHSDPQKEPLSSERQRQPNTWSGTSRSHRGAWPAPSWPQRLPQFPLNK